jgi:hypothetical protein
MAGFSNYDTDLTKLHLNHPRITAEDWRAPLICRLLQSKTYSDSSKQITDSFRSDMKNASNGTMLLHWANFKQDFDRRINTYQDSVLTEHAALGLACMLVHHRLAMQLTEVTMRGEKVDYWLGDKELAIEVGGRQEIDLDQFCDEKATEQLLKNPFGRDGYVCVAEFSTARAKLWFYSYSQS